MRRSLIAAASLLLLSLPIPSVGAGDAPPPGGIFRDCPDCPVMIVVPAGAFAMGSPKSVTEREGLPEPRGGRERPVHRVEIPAPLAVGRYEVTRGQYADFVAATRRSGGPGCQHWTGDGFAVDPDKDWRDPGYAQSDGHPVTCVSWEDATAYAAWLAKTTGQPYRLPSEAEWEYVARAGSDTARFWGDDAKAACGFANVYDSIAHMVASFPDMTPHGCDDGYVETSPVGSFQPNDFGLHDTAGNVWEWVADCWHPTYRGAPADGSAWTRGGDCGQHVLRGGAWISIPRFVRSANRSKMDADARIYRNGFRVVRDLKP